MLASSFLMKEPLAGDDPILMLGIFDLVTPSARSASYVPGPIVSTSRTIRFSPIVKDLEFELKRMPSSYYPGAASGPPVLAKEAGLAGERPMSTVAVLTLVIASARSGEY